MQSSSLSEKGEPITPEAFLKMLIKHTELIPTAGHCMSVLFLHDLYTFRDSWDDWILRSLLAHGYEVCMP